MIDTADLKMPLEMTIKAEGRPLMQNPDELIMVFENPS